MDGLSRLIRDEEREREREMDGLSRLIRDEERERERERERWTGYQG